jgi:hypothetical protein
VVVVSLSQGCRSVIASPASLGVTLIWKFLVISQIRDNHHKTQALLTPITVARVYTSIKVLLLTPLSNSSSIIPRELN